LNNGNNTYSDIAQLANMAANLLECNVKNIGVSRNLFDLGMDSLLIAVFISSVQKNY